MAGTASKGGGSADCTNGKSDQSIPITQRTKQQLKKIGHLKVEGQQLGAAHSKLLYESEGILKAENGEQTYKISQQELLLHVDEGTKQKVFNFRLPYGPYLVDYTRAGRHLLVAGSRGSAAAVDCQTMKQLFEITVKETIRDACFLHNYKLWAAAQKKYTYVYDSQGIEIHCLKDLMGVKALQLLPYHFLLASIGDFGELSYTDISTGQIAQRWKTKRGPCEVMQQNPTNAVVNLGHTKGTVSLWTPNIAKPAMEILCHKGKVTAVEAYQNTIYTAGVDGHWKIWDIRRGEVVKQYKYTGRPPTSIKLSQSGLLGVGFGPHLQIWKTNPKSSNFELYMNHTQNGEMISSFAFQPYEDMCAFGSSSGISTVVVPGAGFANYDSLEANPYETKKQSQDREVRQLLEKLPPSMISLDVGKLGLVNRFPKATLETFEASKTAKSIKKKFKQRGRDGPGKGEKKRERAISKKTREETKRRNMEILTAKRERIGDANGCDMDALSRFK